VTAVGTVPPIRWAGGSLQFALVSEDPAVRALAETVFRPWATHDDRPDRVWCVDRLNGDEGDPKWRVVCSMGTETWVSSPARAVSAVEYAAVSTIVESPIVIMHGALVSWDGRGVLIVGRGEAGKSTLACALWARGAALLGDDVVLLDPARAVARPAPRRVSLRAASRALLGDELFVRIMRGSSSVVLAESHLFHPDEIEPSPRAAAIPLAAIVILTRRGATAPPASRAPILPAHALLALLPYSNLRPSVALGDTIRTLAPLADVVPVFDVGRGPLPEMVTTIEGLVRATPAAHAGDDAWRGPAWTNARG
jgi:hypothetical protein